MNPQTQLFGRDIEPIARNSDPWTSHAAARKFLETGRRDTIHKRIVRHLMSYHISLTAMEIGRGIDYRSPWKRMPELERLGLVVRAGTRKCTVTGETATTWELR